MILTELKYLDNVMKAQRKKTYAITKKSFINWRKMTKNSQKN